MLRGEDGVPAAVDGRKDMPPSDEAAARLLALADADVQDLTSKLLENTLLNLIREAAHAEFDPTVPPVTVLRRK